MVAKRDQKHRTEVHAVLVWQNKRTITQISVLLIRLSNSLVAVPSGLNYYAVVEVANTRLPYCQFPTVFRIKDCLLWIKVQLYCNTRFILSWSKHISQPHTHEIAYVIRMSNAASFIHLSSYKCLMREQWVCFFCGWSPKLNQ